MSAAKPFLNNTIICLMGFSGIGKYTIAKELNALAGVRVVDNHLTSNPIFSLIEINQGTEVPLAAWDKIRAIRDIVYEAIATVAPNDFSFVFTNQLLDDDPKYGKAYDKMHDLAGKRNALFVPVRLLCNAEANRQRIADPQRLERLKPTNPDNVAKLQGRDIFQPNHANTLTLDISDLSGHDAAVAILAHIETLQEPQA